jgi:small nuclear ribonucleoprotein (snRNP)-like protein
MNIALEKTEEYVAGRLRNRYGDVFIRGNNGTSSAPFTQLRQAQS